MALSFSLPAVLKRRSNNDTEAEVDVENVKTISGHVRTPIERSLVLRLDLFLMCFGCISQVIKYLDQVRCSTRKLDSYLLTLISLTSKTSARLMCQE